MKTRTVVLEVEIEGHVPDATELRDEIWSLSRLNGEQWRVIRAEVLKERQP